MENKLITSFVALRVSRSGLSMVDCGLATLINMVLQLNLTSSRLQINLKLLNDIKFYLFRFNFAKIKNLLKFADLKSILSILIKRIMDTKKYAKI